MELMMFIGNDCIDSVTIEQSLIVFPGYTSHFVRLLKRRNERLLSEINSEPEYLFYNYSVNIPAQVFELPNYRDLENRKEYPLAV